ncbi:ER membrane protein complex subunit 4-like [Tubulanus polymorphus]|uniref:ER membrane protein complex subunit 4-like n=1 Tax=Tubulanus polymorphus TaxID=672921 RepID=UPI003DA61B26
MASRGGKYRNKWAMDFANKLKSDRQIVPISSPDNLAAPMGYTDRTIADNSHKDVDPNLVVKKSWDIALGPIKQIPMNLFIMWMAGNTISIFPIMMVGMMFIRPIQALIAVQTTFKLIEGNQAIAQKFMYFVGNIAALVLAIYKCQTMGLLPTHPSDWLAFVQPQKRMEWSGGGMML